MSRERSNRLCATAVALLVLAAVTSCGQVSQPAPDTAVSTTATAPTRTLPDVTPLAALAPVAGLMNDAIAAHRLPGAVVQIGHRGDIVFRQAFGVRKFAGEPGLDGTSTPAEPMTEDTIFDLASLSKSLTTAVAVLQLYEQHQISIDEPVQTYLPEFNPSNDPRRARVTLRMLLTHTSGIAGDLSLDGPWGLDRADKAEGIKRALGAWVVYEPGELFHYSDIGFIILGALIEKVTGQELDTYMRDNVFGPLGMDDTRYLPAAGTWSTDLLARIAPTALDEDTPDLNPDYGRPLRGTVHDPTARRMGGVAGSAGVFSTVHDVGLFAQALLDRLAGRPSPFPLTQSNLEVMTTPQQPGHSLAQLEAANEANRQAIESAPNTTDPLLAPHYPAIAGQDLRGFGWDIDTAHSRPRGMVFPIGSFGHTGFTGVTLWIDPGSDTYVVVLSNVIHQRGGPPVAGLSGDIATVTARALHLYGS